MIAASKFFWREDEKMVFYWFFCFIRLPGLPCLAMSLSALLPRRDQADAVEFLDRASFAPFVGGLHLCLQQGATWIRLLFGIKFAVVAHHLTGISSARMDAHWGLLRNQGRFAVNRR